MKLSNICNYQIHEIIKYMGLLDSCDYQLHVTTKYMGLSNISNISNI